MKYTFICDESHSNKRYLVLGEIILPRHNHPLLVNELTKWKKSKNLNPQSEFKWNKVSNKYLPYYEELVRWFFDHLNANHLLFRAHVIDTAKREYKDYGEGDKERSFYKVYYHLLYQGIKKLIYQMEVSSVLILLDDKFDRYPFHLPIIKKTLNSAIRRDFNLEKLVANVEPRKSSGFNCEPIIQIVDILIGAIGFVRNSYYHYPYSSKPKKDLVDYIENIAKTNLNFDTSIQSRFNIWTFDVEKSIKAKKKRID